MKDPLYHRKYHLRQLCCDDFSLIENYEQAKADDFKDWDCHHRLETHNSNGERRFVNITPEELEALDMYFHRPANELIFLRHGEHKSLHMKGYTKGKSNSFYGRHHSNETKRKTSASLRSSTKFKEAMRSLECRKKKSEANKGKHWKLVDGKRVWY